MHLFCFAESFSVDCQRKFELLSLCAFKSSYIACITTFESNFVGWSTENIRASKIKATLIKTVDKGEGQGLKSPKICQQSLWT